MRFGDGDVGCRCRAGKERERRSRTKIDLCTAQACLVETVRPKRGCFPHAGAGAGGEECVAEMDRRMRFMERKRPR